MNKYIAMSAVALALSAPLAARASSHITIRIFASDAVEKPLREIGYMFEKQHKNVKLHYEFAASGLFMASITQGVPPDIYIASSNRYQNELINRAEINFPVNVAYSKLAAAEPCYNPVNGSRFRTITPRNLVAHLRNPDVHLLVASPVLSPEGRFTQEMLQAINRKAPGSYARIMGHATEKMSPNFIMPYVVNGSADMGVVYASQVAGARREGACVNETAIPARYNKKVIFSAAVLNPSTLRVVSEARKGVDAAYEKYLTSAAGQRVFKKWGFVPAA